jgi:hypothetical protein
MFPNFFLITPCTSQRSHSFSECMYILYSCLSFRTQNEKNVILSSLKTIIKIDNNPRCCLAMLRRTSYWLAKQHVL